MNRKHMTRISTTMIAALIAACLLGSLPAWSNSRIKDIVTIENSSSVSLIGYGLVVGLGGTGDRSSGSSRGAIFTVQSIRNMLERFGITVDQSQLRTRNVAAVMVTATMPPFGRVGSQFDVTVSSLGDARSLEGGVLLMTPLSDPGGQQFGLAQGPVSIGGYNVETTAGERLRKNHALVGRVPTGAQLTAAPPAQGLDPAKPLTLLLIEPDFSTAQRIAAEINSFVQSGAGADSVARAMGPDAVEITFPQSVSSTDDAVSFIADIERLEVAPDVEARVVINEKTGTVVAGGAVTIGEVMISHGDLTIHTTRVPVISQPTAFSRGGQTVVDQVTNTQAQENPTPTGVIAETTTVTELADALNRLGMKPRDIISIFQSIKQAGALRAKLIIN